MIWKMPIRQEPVVQVHVPKGAVFISADFQGDEIYTYAIVEAESQDTENRTFKVAKTNEAIDLNGHWLFVATCQKGEEEFHLFVDDTRMKDSE